jgi:hypothetical protein
MLIEDLVQWINHFGWAIGRMERTRDRTAQKIGRPGG